MTPDSRESIDALDGANPFSKVALWVVIGVAVVSLATAIVLTVVSRDPAEESTSATSDAYSVSAIGHKGFVELLGKLDIPVVVTQLGGGEKANEGLLVIAEPRSRSVPDLRRKIAGARRVLVVLPKWYGLWTADSPWIDSAQCTSCDECIGINPKIFAYDENKHAFVKNAKGGPYKDLVRAAEKCTAQVIHPGTPFDPKEKDIDKLIKRAAKYN